MPLTWAQFVAEVNTLITVDSGRVGSELYISELIRIGAVNLQDAIDYYQAGHVSSYEFDDCVREGYTSRISLPSDSYLRELYHVRLTDPAIERPLYWYPHVNRRDLVAGVVNCRRTFHFSADPQAKFAWVYPAITPGYAVKLVWNGSRDDFADSDLVPFDRPAALVVAHFVKWQLMGEVYQQPARAALFERQYIGGLRALRVKCRDRLMETTQPTSWATCVPGYPSVSACLCGGSSAPATGYAGSVSSSALPTLDWVMFGDSGDPSTAQDTVDLSAAVRALNPSLIVHLGDANYQQGSSVSIGDNFVRHFWSWIQSGDIFAAYGNHDLMTSYGDPLTGILLAQQAAIGATRILEHRLWFTIKRGPVEFFVLNSGLDSSDPEARTSEQYVWLRAALAASASTWKVVVFHRAPYSSDTVHRPGATELRWPFKSWGADVVVSSHAHGYERLMAGGLPFLVCGLGGAPRYAFGSPLPESQFRWSSDIGFLRCFADDTTLQMTLVNAHTGDVVDQVTLLDDGQGVSTVYGDNYQYINGLLQIFNTTTSGYSTLRLVGPSGSPGWLLDEDGNTSGGQNHRWLTPTCLQIFNGTAGTWHPIFWYGPDDAPAFSIGEAGDTSTCARIEGGVLQLLNLTTSNYLPIFLYGTPPTIAAG